jgi:arylsulfatase A-like enzyme
MPQLGFAFVLFLAIVARSLTAGAEEPAASSRPNVLFIVADDLRSDAIGPYANGPSGTGPSGIGPSGIGPSGISAARTPALDRLAAVGTVFRRAVCANPICVSSRAEILTGLSTVRAGNDPARLNALVTSTPRWPQTMLAAGYRTGYVGKWHTSGRPSAHGYAETFALFGGGGGKFPAALTTDAHGRPITGYRGWVFQDDAGRPQPDLGIGLTPNISERFADGAIEFLNQADERPFFLHVNFTAPHDPRLVPRGYERAYDASRLALPKNFAADHPFDHGNQGGRDELLLPRPLTASMVRDELKVYYALVEHTDAQIGRILAALEERKSPRPTIIVFTSDHGLALGSHGLVGKQNMYEHTIGVPLIVAGPNVPQGESQTAPCYLRDLFPTICEMCRIPTPPSLDGRSLQPLFAANQNADTPTGGSHAARPGPHEFTVGYFGDVQRMIRTDRWKLIRYPKLNREQLFNLHEDPHELRDRIGDEELKPIADELRTKLRTWLAEHGDALGG